MPVLAQPVGYGAAPPPNSAAATAPGRAARLADLSGQVWLYDTEQRQWVTAERNRPLTSGDRLATDRSAHAEVRVGSTVLRLDGDTELDVALLDDDHFQLQLHRGACQVQLRDSDWAEQFQMVTAEGRLRPDRPGTYRFDRIGSRTQATALSGQLIYEGPQQALTIESGQRAEFLFDGNGRAQYALIEPLRDAFYAWNLDRDRRDRAAEMSQRYVSPEMTGAEELDRYGRWEVDPDYGPLWIPLNVAPGWASYTTGRWAWVAPWGWTWVDVAPWGFAPFHYGRWVQRGPYWAWSPGGYVARPVYAPALVGWVGAPPVHRPGVSIDISIGIGGGRSWYPLTPRDRYVPAFRSPPHYEREWNREWNHPPMSDRDHWWDRDERRSPPLVPRIERGELNRGPVAAPSARVDVQPAQERLERQERNRPELRDWRHDSPSTGPATAPPRAVVVPPASVPAPVAMPMAPPPAAPAVLNGGERGQDPGRDWRHEGRRPDRERDARPVMPAAPAAPVAPMAPAAPPVLAPPAPRPAPRDDDRRGRVNEEIRQQMDRSGDGRYGGAARNDRGERSDRPDRGNRDNNRDNGRDGGRDNNRGDRSDPRNGN